MTTNIDFCDEPPGSWSCTPQQRLRDEFAMAALQGFLAADYGGSTVELCEAAYEVANAMMAERDRPARGEPA